MTDLAGKQIQYSKEVDTSNSDGILCTTKNHEKYVQMLNEVIRKVNSENDSNQTGGNTTTVNNVNQNSQTDSATSQSKPSYERYTTIGIIAAVGAIAAAFYLRNRL